MEILKITKIPIFFCGFLFLYSSGIVIYPLSPSSKKMALAICLFIFSAIYCLIYYKKNAAAKYLNEFMQRLNIFKIVLLGAFLRFFYLWIIDKTQISDFAYYNTYAIEILKGASWINPEKAVGVSIITAFFYKIFGIHMYAALIPITMISVFEIYLVYKIGEKIFNKNAGLFAGLVLALFPEHILFNNLIGSDTYFSFLILLSLFILFYKSKANIFTAAISGFILGISMFFRPNSFLFLAAILFVLFLKNVQTNIYKFIGLSVSILLAFFIAVSPIAYYNQKNFGFLSISPSQKSGWYFLLSTNPKYKGLYNTEDYDLMLQELNRRENPGEQRVVTENKIAREIGMKRIFKNPFIFILNTVIYKPIYLWAKPAVVWSLSSVKIKMVKNILMLCCLVFYKIILIVSSIMLLFSKDTSKLKNDIIYTYLCCCSIVTISHFFLEVQERYHHAFIPFLALLSGAFIYTFSSLPPWRRPSSGDRWGGTPAK